MRILFVGDIIGRVGRKVLQEHLDSVRYEQQVDFTVVNVENSAGGYGVTAAIAEKVIGMGVDVLTSGNHVWDQKEVFNYLPGQPRLLRPANYPPGLPGSGVWVGFSSSGVRVAVLNLQGRVFMPLTDCPFRRADEELERLQGKADVTLIDFHAEATSEKMAFGWHVNGRVSAVIGTHTHVPTADARVLSGGTAYVSDVGMTGSYESVIGMRVEESLNRLLTSLHGRFAPATEDPRFSAVVIEVDESSGRAVSIQRCDRPAWGPE
jgi:2',3'-cyclic-nucleotide 2'-phosphodiesterase